MNEQPHEQQPVHLAEAAAALGISVDAVRMRVKRGQLRGLKDGRAWLVYLSPPPSAQAEPNNRTNSERTHREHSALFVQLQSENAWLRARLERAEEERAELRRMLNLEQQTLAAVRSLPAPAVQPDSPENGLGTVVPTSELSASASALRNAVKAAGVKGKKTRRRLLARLADALRGA